MRIESVLTYRGSWPTLLAEHEATLDRLVDWFDNNYASASSARHITGLTPDPRRRRFPSLRPNSPSRTWPPVTDPLDSLFSGDANSLPARAPLTPSRKYKTIEKMISGVAASGFTVRQEDFATWLFVDCPALFRQGHLLNAVMFAPHQGSIDEFDRATQILTFEYIEEQVDESILPLLPQPFSIVGVSGRPARPFKRVAGTVNVSVREIRGEVSADESKILVDRSIEFPPEYHQAGLGILSYFQTYLNRKYPDANCTVRIEQHGLKVRLVIVGDDGQLDVVEQALHEYELVATGRSTPEDVTGDRELILELRQELRIAQLRVEAKQDLVSYQQQDIQRLSGLLAQALRQDRRQDSPINLSINFKPTVSANAHAEATTTISFRDVFQAATELLAKLPREIPASSDLTELREAVGALPSGDASLQTARPLIERLRRVIENVASAGSVLRRAVDAAEGGAEVAGKLITAYNLLATGLGLPTCPNPFGK